MPPRTGPSVRTYHTLEPPDEERASYDWFVQLFCNNCQGIEWLDIHEFVITKLNEDSIKVKLMVCKTCGRVVFSVNKQVVKVLGQVRPDHLKTLEWLFGFKEISVKDFRGLERIKHFLEEENGREGTNNR